MISISIQEEAHNETGMADVLRHIASQLEQGYTSGYYPTWDLIGDAEEAGDEV